MEHRVAPAGRGLAWLRQAIGMLDRNPRGLIQIACAYVLIEFVPNLLVGALPDLAFAFSILLLLLGPALMAGLLHAIDQADAGHPLSPLQLFEGLRRPGVRAQLLVLGVFMLVEVVLIGLLVQRVLGPGNWNVLLQVANQQIKPDSPAAQAAAIPMLKAMMAALAVGFFLLTGLFFAVPRVMFDGRGAATSVVESFVACAANVLPLTVYGLLLIVGLFAMGVVLGIVAAVLGLFGAVGQLLIVPVIVAMGVLWLLVSASGNYLAWREVFGRSGAGKPPPRAGILV
ncbi:MAG TPA: BPSS1780 family membrane protein [Xanthomonadaceae bacterium]|jgi:hypothetical protein|nr:BPSS1780 family membrane protein [Xanthomonadaceae bacterium]